MRKGIIFLPLLLPLLTDCGSSAPGPAPVTSLFVVPTTQSTLADVHYLDLPWPSDYRKASDGTVSFTGLYNPRLVPLLDDYVNSMAGVLTGFSPVAYGYYRFTGDIDPTTLPPDPQHTILAGATVQIVDVDPNSPEHGQRKLVQTYWQQTDGIYWQADTLAIGPALGYPLRPSTRYATVVTKGVLTTAGKPVLPSSNLLEVLGVNPPSARTKPMHDLYAPAVADLAANGVPTSSIAHLAVFTTNDPTAEVFAIADALKTQVPAPTFNPTMWSPQPSLSTPDYDVYYGVYGPSPNYQQGTIPFNNTGRVRLRCERQPGRAGNV